MAFDETLASRVRKLMSRRRNVTERRMLGGLAFLLNGNMCCSVGRDRILIRTGPAKYEEALGRPHTREMNFTGRTMKGYIYVDPAGYESDEDLKQWVGAALEFVSSLPPKSKD